MKIKSKYAMTLSAGLFAFGLCRSTVTLAAPLVTLTNLSCLSGSNASFVLQAWPGDYAIQSRTNLSEAWTNETDVSIGASGVYAGIIPMLGRSPLFLRAQGRSPSDGLGCVAQFTTLGSDFAPEVVCQGNPSEFTWYWSDGTTSTNRPVASKSFGSNAQRVQGLKVDPTNAIVSINLGFDGADGGETTPLAHTPQQNVSAVRIPYPLPGLRWWASSYNPIVSTLDFSGCTSLEAIECYSCTPLQRVVVTNLPALTRVCVENCVLRELDLSSNPNLADVRAANNAITNILVGGGTGPKIWHWCTRDNPQLTQRLCDLMTNFFSLQYVYLWNDNQRGPFVTASTNLIDVLIDNNHFTSADFSGQSRMAHCQIYANDLTNLVVTGCTGLQELNASHNKLTTAALDHILSVMDTSAPNLRILNLSYNPQPPSSNGYASYTNLVNRGVAVTVD